MGSQCSVGMRIALSLDLAPDLLDVMTSLVPASSYIRLVRIKTTPMPMMVVGFDIGPIFHPSLHRSHAKAHPFGDLIDFGPLLPECHHLLIAIIPLCLMG